MNVQPAESDRPAEADDHGRGVGEVRPPTQHPPHYEIVALRMTIYYNRDGDHDHNGMMFALKANEPILRYIDALGRQGGLRRPGAPPPPDPSTFFVAASARAHDIGVQLPATPAQARLPHPLVRPLVLRARRGEEVTARLHNTIKNRDVGLHLVGGGYDVETSDGSHVGNNPASLTPPDRVYTWSCLDEGVFPFHDGGDYDGGEDGTNVHGLFGALIVEPPGTTWRDPRTNQASHGPSGSGPFQELDGLFLDVLPPGQSPLDVPESDDTLADREANWPTPAEHISYEDEPYPYREFVIFFHDEIEYVPAHGWTEPNPCDQHEHGGHDVDGPGAGERGGHGTGGGGHGGDDELPIMAVSYRSEPMINRERTLWRLLRTGHVLQSPVLNEEQHHSSWMFGDPADNLLLQAYIGDRVRIRFVHAAVKETHVFHLHLYEWHAVADDTTSPRIDAISVSPQTGHTIEPAWGAGNRHQVAGDVIWHCHLYPHFHEGMWGIFRTFETRQYGKGGLGPGAASTLDTTDPLYAGRRIGEYPDGTVIHELLPLPGNPPPKPTRKMPGFPLYIPGTVRQKSPRPPWPDRDWTTAELADPQEPPPCGLTSLRAEDMPADFDYRSVPTDLERAAFNELPVPGELFTRNRMAKMQATWEPELLARNTSREVCHDLVVDRRRIDYNDHGWHDKDGHLFYLEGADPADAPGPTEPLFFRARQGQIVNVTLRNALPAHVDETEFDHAFPPCPQMPWEGECGAHVHMVKFDPICADGASVGWNYISGARLGRRMVHRWWADQQFGTIFFHDHLFANYRQKHGLFGAMVVEPAGSTFFHHIENDREIVTGLQALIRRHGDDVGSSDGAERAAGPVDRTTPVTEPGWFREFCIGIADFIPMWDRLGRALNPPPQPGGHGDQGVMGLNYRSEPLRERPGDPAHWFSSHVHGDPATTVFQTYEADPIWFRVLQGSHEESHSFQVHGLRWQRFRDTVDTAIKNQQATGISEAFTFINRAPVGQGDYLYKLSGIDDLWLGCWGIIRAHQRPAASEDCDLLTFGADPEGAYAGPAPTAPVRTFHITAAPRPLSYRSDLIDPYGLIYRLDKVDGQPVPPPPAEPALVEPLVLWCREGEVVKIVLANELPAGMATEPFAPEVPVDRDRPVSRHASMHADLVAYDVRTSDGANVGLNPMQSVPPGLPGASRTYIWDTTHPLRAQPGDALDPILLQDMADVRNHRHHGLVGALIVLPPGVTPYPVGAGESTSSSATPTWYGPRVTVRPDETGADDAEVTEEMVALLQDGLRLFLNGNTRFPLPDPPGEMPGEAEHEDQGQKGINYRSEPLGQFDPGNSEYQLNKVPATPVWSVPKGSNVRFHLVGALDKPRAYSFTIHGVSWPEHRYDTGLGLTPQVSSESAITSGTGRTFRFQPQHTGDHAYRTGVLSWALGQGMWGILRVT